jgi:hypothetical protein
MAACPTARWLCHISLEIEMHCHRKWNAYSALMKVAKKSPKRRLVKRATLTLPAEGYRAVDELRGDLSRSSYLHSLLEREKARRQREAFVIRVNAQCTEAFCREAVRLNARLPVHGET